MLRLVGTGAALARPEASLHIPAMADVFQPCQPPGEIGRASLLPRLDRPGSLVVVAAPAGFGKTVLLRQFTDMCRRRGDVCILIDGEGGVGVGAALWRAIDACLSVDAGSVRPSPCAVAAALSRLGRAGLIVIDDFHQVIDEGDVALVRALAQGLPSNITLVVAGRERPPLGLARLMVEERLIEIGPQQLAFEASEIANLLPDAADRAQCEEARTFTGGWPAGLRILCRMRGEVPVAPGLSFAEQAAFHDRALNHYLAEQIFDPLPHDVRHFLLWSAALVRVGEPVVEQLGERRSDLAAYDWVRANRLLIDFVDREQDWFNYVPLFHRFLLRQLRRRMPDAAAGLHKRAADWFVKNGHVREGLAHAAQSGDRQFMEAMVAEAGNWRVYLGIGARAWEEMLAAEGAALRDHPELGLGRAYYAAQRGRIAEARLLLEDMRGLDAEVGERKDVSYRLLFDYLFSAYEDQVLPVDVIREQAGGIDRSPGPRSAKHALVFDILAWAEYADGRFDAARLAAEACVRDSHEAQVPVIGFYGKVIGGLAINALGDATEAMALWHSALRLAQTNFGEGSDQVLTAKAFLSEAYFEAGDMDAAAQYAEEAVKLLRRGDAWTDLGIAAYRVTLSTTRRRDGLAAAVAKEQAIARAHVGERHRRLRAMTRLILLDEAITAGDAGDAGWRSPVEQGELDALCSHRDWRAALPALLCKARYALHCGMPAEARDALERVQAELDRAPVQCCDAQRRLLLAMFNRASGRPKSALREAAEGVSMLAQANRKRLVADYCSDMGELFTQLLKKRSLLGARETGFLEDCLRLAQSQANTHEQDEDGKLAHLSPRERQVLDCLAKGMTSKEIASLLNISINTTMGYRRSLYQKLDVARRSQAVAILSD